MPSNKRAPSNVHDAAKEASKHESLNEGIEALVDNMSAPRATPRVALMREGIAIMARTNIRTFYELSARDPIAYDLEARKARRDKRKARK